MQLVLYSQVETLTPPLETGHSVSSVSVKAIPSLYHREEIFFPECVKWLVVSWVNHLIFIWVIKYSIPMFAFDQSESFPLREERILRFWQEKKLFERSVEERKGKLYTKNGYGY